MLEAHNKILRTLTFSSQNGNQPWHICRAWNDDYVQKKLSPNSIEIIRYHDFNLENCWPLICFSLLKFLLSTYSDQSWKEKKKFLLSLLSPLSSLLSPLSSLLSPLSSIFALLYSLLSLDAMARSSQCRVWGNDESKKASEEREEEVSHTCAFKRLRVIVQ